MKICQSIKGIFACNKNIVKRISTYISFTAFKISKNITGSKTSLLKTNKNYGLVIKGMYKYYDMKLVTFGIDQNRNLIIQFPVFVQPYTQKPLTLYQVETIQYRY